jgi:hypothetical protein
MTDPVRFGAPGCTCRPFTADPPRFLDQPGDSIDTHTSWQRGQDCEHHAAVAERDEETGVGWTQLEARAFNAVGPAVRDAGQWLPLTARRAVARAVLTAVREHLDIGEEEAWCKTCRRVWDGPSHQCETEAEQQIARVRKVLAERRTEVAERETDGMLEFGTPGASWCDAVTVTCDRIDYALKVFPPAGWIRCTDDQPKEQP